MYVFGADLNALLAPNLIAKLTASSLTAIAVCLVFLTLVRFATRRAALVVAVGLGLGTNFWALHSQTMALHDVVAFGLALTLYNWMRPTPNFRRGICGWRVWSGAGGYGAHADRPACRPPGLGLLARVGWRRGLLPLGFAVSLFGVLLAFHWHWFGNLLGAVPMLESLDPEVHAVTGTVSHEPWVGAFGLLISPRPGLSIFSPIVLIALIGIRPALRLLPDQGLGWALAASLALYVVYAVYTVWWGGHSYGPRYLLDGLVFLTPPAAVAIDRVVRARWAQAVCAIALAWSMIAAGTGAFFSDNWNTSPAEVDLHHERLWDWHDPEILRAWHNGLSPKNFSLFDREPAPACARRAAVIGC